MTARTLAILIVIISGVLVTSLAETATAKTSVSGYATWYCGHGSGCTHGYGPGDLVAAIDRKDSAYRKGDRVRVSHDGRSVVVTIVDVCACRGDRVIDLTSGAFARLAPLSQGVVSVTLTGAARIALPQTSTVDSSLAIPPILGTLETVQ